MQVGVIGHGPTIIGEANATGSSISFAVNQGSQKLGLRSFKCLIDEPQVPHGIFLVNYFNWNMSLALNLSSEF